MLTETIQAILIPQELFQLITFHGDFIYRWQTLIGSFLGPFLAVALTVVGFMLKGKYQRWKERKEAIRFAEISFAQTINHLMSSIIELEGFIERVTLQIKEITEVNDSIAYARQYTNYPPLADVYFDKDIIKMKFKSYYLHNKILIIDHAARLINSAMYQFGIDYEKLLKNNQILAEKMHPEPQRIAYVQNLNSYTNMVEGFLKAHKEKTIFYILQAKVYNLKLMNKHFRTLWKYEKSDLRYFRNKQKIKEYNLSLDAVKRIDDLMKEDTEKLFTEMKERAVKS
ncbi:MAG: hypothetical protein ABII13_00100 [Patescibacteria group bacterium]|nr:hypothetical protein [Patescibacteria group bacterium]MBU2509426.1 hypothetical protein [Patescibacteria group bacterium]